WGECASQSSAADPHQPFRQALGLMVGDTAAASPTHLLSDHNAARLKARASAAVSAVLAHGPSLVGRFVGSESLFDRLEDTLLEPGVASELAVLLQSPDSGPGTQGINEQVFRVLSQYAEAGPVILVLEDLHWADVGTAALIFHVVRRLHQQSIPILLVGSYRASDLYEDAFRRLSPIASTVREALRYYPSPVIDLSSAVGSDAGQAFVEAIVKSTLDGASPELAESMFQLTGGLPLFVVALIDWYRIEGNGAARTIGSGLTWRNRAHSVPTRLDSALAYLIDRLPANLQSLITIASVQGTVVSAELLQHVTGLSRFELMDALDHNLHRRYQLLVPAGTSVTAGIRSHDYRFSHALLRDVLYDRLNDLEREHYHGATADAMVAIWSESPHAGSARIAHHYAQAGDQRASAEFALKAGNHALEMHEYDRASHHFRSIQELGASAASPHLIAQSLVGLGNCGRGTGELEDARSKLGDAIDLARRYRLPLVHAAALTSMAMLDFDSGQMASGTQRLGEAVEELLAHGDRTEASRSLYLLSHTLHGIGRYDDADERARQAIALAEDLENDALLTGATIALANVRLELGSHAEAIGMYRFCLQVCEAQQYVHRAAVCRLNIALAHYEQDQIAAAREALGAVFAVRHLIPARLVGAAEFNLAVCDEESGNAGHALQHYQASLDIRIQVGQEALIIDSLAGLARSCLSLGHPEDASHHTDEIERRIAEHGLDGIEHPGRLFVTLYRVHDALGRHERAISALRRALYALAERSALLKDPADRRSYLLNVPSHRLLIGYGQESGVIEDWSDLTSTLPAR
ncbi:MAG TPA: hypothetical protein VD767_10390, partial [Thermomicrobiales bacterium]|nr:hypothetical protein [Thermomicrobiales bacterium]